jgi:hypothetical protein
MSGSKSNIYESKVCKSAPMAQTIAWAVIATAAVWASCAPAGEARSVLVVPAADAPLRIAVPLPPALKLKPDQAVQLYEPGGAGQPIAAQLAPAIAEDGTVDSQTARLLAVIPPSPVKATSNSGGPESSLRRLVLRSVEKVSADGPAFALEDVDDKSLKLSYGGKPVMVYNHGVITNPRVPASDHRRSRACYVHPLWGLSGEELTDDFPKDHYHHHGVFWTWPHVGVDGKQHDLWAGNTIWQRFVRWLGRQTGPTAAVLGVENGWFVGQQKVMIERVWFCCYADAEDSRVLDLNFTFIPTDKPITLQGAEGKSYGGLTVRFKPGARKDTLITIPSGPTTEDLPDTKLQWADFTSLFAGATQRSGAAIFIHPQHPDYPPTWLTRYYGPLCVGWPGVKAKTFPPGKLIQLQYRIWIHRNAVDVDRLRNEYQAYLSGTQARWK